MRYIANTDLIPTTAQHGLSPRAQGGQCLFRPAGDTPPAEDAPPRIVYPRIAEASERWTRIY